jgi:hypothetical protein
MFTVFLVFLAFGEGSIGINSDGYIHHQSADLVTTIWDDRFEGTEWLGSGVIEVNFIKKPGCVVFSKRVRVPLDMRMDIRYFPETGYLILHYRLKDCIGTVDLHLHK